MRELSVFCDESGDFGPVATHAPCYIVCLVLHEQNRPIEEPVAQLVRAMQDQGFEGFAPVHTAPLIRREGKYSTLDGTARKKMFDILFSFFRKCPVSCKTFAIDKRWHGTGAALEARLAHELDVFLRDNSAYFHGFERVIVYYDRGQKQVSRVLQAAFSTALSNLEFRTVDPRDYLLFQCADLACTVKLVDLRRREFGLSRSESAFFGGAGRFAKTYLKVFNRKSFSGK